VERFGTDVVAQGGTIDRAALGAKVFGKPEALERLTDIVWPEIRRLAGQEIERTRAVDPDAVVVLEAAVLLEASWEDMVDEVWVVTVERETAVERLMARNQFSREQALARIESQLSEDERRARADRAIDNSGTPEGLRGRLKAEWDRLQ
jgi:dephospho-CoA kinase